MSSTKAKQNKSISDKISDLLVPRPLLDPEIDSGDETTAKTTVYDDDVTEDNEIDLRLSDIRKGNVKLLQDVDPKYSGRVASRKDFESSDSDGDDAKNDYEDSSEDEAAVAEFSMRLKQFKDSDDEQDQEKDSIDADKSPVIHQDSDSGDVDSLNDGSILAAGAIESEDEDSGGENDVTDEDESDYDDGGGGGGTENEDEKEGDNDEETVTIKPADATLEIQKGVAIQNQLQIWEKLLEVRIHSQKLLIKANSLPHFTKMETLKSEGQQMSAMMKKTSDNVEHLLKKMCEMQSLLVSQFPETKELSRKRASDRTNNDGEPSEKYARLLANDFTDYKNYRDSTILKWYDRTKVLTPGTKEAKHQATNSTNILQNIEGVLANRADLIKKTQLHKGGYEIIGLKRAEAPSSLDPASHSDNEPVAGESEDADQQIYSEEIYDDTDFYHTQLRELIEFKANTSNPTEMAKQFIELQRIRKKMKKVVDTRASKGRKIRYVVHNKMVNFMARHDPTEWTDDAKNELYSSLFGARMQV